MRGSPATINLCRHCTTAWNLQGRLQGTIDLPLADVGIREAKAHVSIVRDIGVRRIVCSTALRAYQTAMVYAESLQLPVHRTPQLRELDHGEWEGRKAEELLLDQNSGFAQWLSDPGSIAIPGGSESVQTAQQRASEGVRNAASTFRDEIVLIIAHKHINALLMCALFKKPLTSFESYIVEDTLPHLLAADAIESLLP